MKIEIEVSGDPFTLYLDEDDRDEDLHDQDLELEDSGSHYGLGNSDNGIDRDRRSNGMVIVGISGCLTNISCDSVVYIMDRDMESKRINRLWPVFNRNTMRT